MTDKKISGENIIVRMADLTAFFKQVGSDWYNDNSLLLGSSLSFYTIFSLPPFLIIMISLSGIFFGADAVEGRIVHEIQDLVGKDGALTIQTVLKNVHKLDSITFTSLVGFLILLAGSTGVFAQLQYSLNTIWNVRAKPDLSWDLLLLKRIFSFVIVLGIGLCLIVSLLASTLLTIFDQYLYRLFQDSFYIEITRSLNFSISFAIQLIIFAVIYKFLPDVKISWKDVGYGSFVTAVLFSIGKFFLGLYLVRSGLGSAYGAAGSVIITFVWIFYASLIFFFGAEITKVYSLKYGSKITPAKNFEFIRPEITETPVTEAIRQEYEAALKKELFLIPLLIKKPT
jgi:membrane protein